MEIATPKLHFQHFAQKMGSAGTEICLNFLLTKCQRHGIIEISSRERKSNDRSRGDKKKSLSALSVGRPSFLALFISPVRFWYYLLRGWQVLYGGSVPYSNLQSYYRNLCVSPHRRLPMLRVRGFAFLLCEGSYPHPRGFY